MKLIVKYILVLILISAKCKNEAIERRNVPLFFMNNSIKSVTVSGNFNENRIAVYPDTNITVFNEKGKVGNVNKGEAIVLVEPTVSWIEYYKRAMPIDTVSIFVIDTDSLNKYPWDTIRSRYLILQRYDLSLKDLENRKFEIEYPYDPSRGKLKVWKP